MGRRARAGLQQRWEQTSLTRRMVVLVVALSGLGIAIVGSTTIGVLQQHLIRQVDAQLEASAEQLAATVGSGEIVDSAASIPTDYCIRRDIPGEKPLVIMTQETERRAGSPLTDGVLQAGEAVYTPSGTTFPLTVRSTVPGETWRVVAVPVPAAGPGKPPGVVTVGLPLADVRETLVSTTWGLGITALGTLLVGGAAGYYLVSRALRPLREIETVASRIAEGDLGSRVPSHGDGTEVGALADSLNAMLAQIETSFRAREASEARIRQFVSNASHELRTPLAAIRGYGELYRIGGVSEDRVADVMGRIESEAARLGTLAKALLAQARLDEGRPLEPSDVDLTELARSAQSDLLALDHKRTVQLEDTAGPTGQPPQSVILRGDCDQLAQMVTNLVGNAARYTPAGSPVEIAAGWDGDWAVFELRDHGPGVSEADRERVFERFYRTDASRARSLGGSGLGLSIAAGIVEAHRGRISLSETAGGGLTVRVELPRNPLAPSGE